MNHNYGETVNLGKIFSSELYNPCDELWLITCYFNPNSYKTKLANYKVFERVIRKSKLNLITVECVFGDTCFELAPFKDVIRVKTNSVMWQKENLLNIAIKKLPATASKVVWIDCDVLFSNPNWAIETSKLLDTFPIVQPYHKLIRLPKDHSYYRGVGDIWNSFAYVWQQNSNLQLAENFHLHGHTGIAWAARVELLKKHGLYDGCISGSADHVMAHAMCGNFKSPCIERILGASKIKNKLFRYFLKWAYPFYQDVQGKVQCVPGEVLHLWHGDIENRQYTKRHEELRKLGFDPYSDLRLSENGTWEWDTSRTELHQWAKKYFEMRLEDG